MTTIADRARASARAAHHAQLAARSRAAADRFRAACETASLTGPDWREARAQLSAAVDTAQRHEAAAAHWRRLADQG